MMHRLRRYDVFRFAKNDVAPFGRNDAMFAQCAVRHTSLGVAVITRRSQHHLRDRQTSFKKRTFVGRQKCIFCCERATKKCVKWGKNDQKYTKTIMSFLLLGSCALVFDFVFSLPFYNTYIWNLYIETHQ